MRMLRFALLITLLLVPIGIYAQTPTPSPSPQTSSNDQPQGFFPDATFTAMISKFLPPRTPYSDFDSWQAKMKIDMTIVRKGRNQCNFDSEFQTVGSKSLGRKTIIAGTGYILGGRCIHSFSSDTKFSAGITHLSSHLTQDLLKLIQDEKRNKIPVPQFNATDLNVVFFQVYHRFASLPLKPEITLRVQPIGFRFHGAGYRYDKPVYLMAEITPWSGHEKRIVIGTQDEFGKDGFKEFFARLELDAKNQREGRFQPFISYSPGKGLHTGPNDGWHRDGLLMGIKFLFRAN